MQFGKVENPELINFELPKDHSLTAQVLTKGGSFEVFVGCAKWNKTDLKNFYPKGIKDELAYYSTQFNSIELNATFYKMPIITQVREWKNKTPSTFQFFPKITNTISHFKRLVEVDSLVQEYCDAVSNFENQLGMVFLQLHDNFKPKDFSRLETFIVKFPKVIPLGVELRNAEWFSDEKMASAFRQLCVEHSVTNILVDTAGRRDMIHMALTTPKAFIRYVGANHASDYKRLDDWLTRIIAWKEAGLERLNFFVHQNIELESPLLSAYFVEKLNAHCGTNLQVPRTITPKLKLF